MLNPTLQQRIGFLVLIALAIGLGLFSLLGIQSMNDSTRRVLEERLTIARIVASHLDETVNHTLVHLQSRADYGGRLPTEVEFRQAARELRDVLGDSGIVTEGVYLVGGEGTILWTEPEQPGVQGLILPGYGDIGISLQKGEAAISGLRDSPATNATAVFAAAPVLSPEGRLMAAIAVAISIRHSVISTYITPLTLGETGYTELIDGNGVVMARTEPGRPPDPFERSDHPGKFAELMEERTAAVRTCHRCHGPEGQVERRRDVLAFAPLTAASWGVAIRQSEDEAFAITAQLKRRLLILGGILVVGVFLLVWLVMQGVVRPLKTLTAAAARVAAGDFEAVTPLRRRDELGQLSDAFASMTRDLAKAQNELVNRNQELLALNSIATTVSESLDLEDVLDTALRKVLDVTRTDAGCIFLAEGDGRRLKLVSRSGSSRFFNCCMAASPEADCACHQALRMSYPLMVNDASQCPVLGEMALALQDPMCFASVPLRAKEKALGVMNVACSEDSCFVEDDFRLLDSIGRQVGLAVENSMLYQETRQKEELRGQLLNATIGAQEEERKRLSRELHDGAGQTLTGLIMSIESAETVVPPAEVVLGRKLAKIRGIAVDLLEDMRKLMQGLRSTVLDDLGLVAAIRYYADTNLEDAGVSVDFEAEGEDGKISSFVETSLFRIAQEGVHNIIKHAGARTARIRISVQDNSVKLLVEDDGRGFDVDAFLRSDARRQSFGLAGMLERAALLGGTVSVRSAVGQGTRIAVEVPLSPQGSNEEASRGK